MYQETRRRAGMEERERETMKVSVMFCQSRLDKLEVEERCMLTYYCEGIYRLPFVGSQDRTRSLKTWSTFSRSLYAWYRVNTVVTPTNVELHHKKANHEWSDTGRMPTAGVKGLTDSQSMRIRFLCQKESSSSKTMA